MRIDHYFAIESAIKRNEELTHLCGTLRWQGVDKKLLEGIQRRTKGLVEELTKLKDVLDGAMETKKSG